MTACTSASASVGNAWTIRSAVSPRLYVYTTVSSVTRVFPMVTFPSGWATSGTVIGSIASVMAPSLYIRPACDAPVASYNRAGHEHSSWYRRCQRLRRRGSAAAVRGASRVRGGVRVGRINRGQAPGRAVPRRQPEARGVENRTVEPERPAAARRAVRVAAERDVVRNAGAGAGEDEDRRHRRRPPLRRGVDVRAGRRVPRGDPRQDAHRQPRVLPGGDADGARAAPRRAAD